MLCFSVSNYLLAFGCSKIVKEIETVFITNGNDSSEISVSKINQSVSLLAISKSQRIIEIEDSKYFFRGWFQDHESRGIVLGGNGFKDWVKDGVNQELVTKTDYEGAYVSAIFSDEKLSVRNDTFSYLPVIHFFDIKHTSPKPVSYTHLTLPTILLV